MLLLKLIIFFLGASLASFALCLGLRLAFNCSLFSRSQCDFCQHTLSAWQLIPILGYFFQKGRCHFCHHPISFFYPIIELAFGIYSLYLFSEYSLPYFFLLITFCWWALMLSVEDFYATSVTSLILFLGGSLLILWQLYLSGFSLPSSKLPSCFFFIFLGLLCFKKLLGLADVYFLLVCLAFLGFYKLLLVVVLACLSLIIYSCFQKINTSLPFLPSLSWALFLVLVLN